MPFSALLDGQRVDLIGDDADDVWSRAEEAKRVGRLRCKGCDGELRLRAPRNKSRHFFHLSRADDCPLGGAPESEVHLRAKKAVAAAIRASGGTAEVEWVSPRRTFVADVLAQWTGQSGDVCRIVFEVQVSSQTRDRTFERDAVREAAADKTVWVLMAGPAKNGAELPAAGWAHWSNEHTSILLAHDNTLAGWWADELAGTDPRWGTTSLLDLISAISRGAVFLAADHSWQRGGWVTVELCHQRTGEIENRRRQEEADRRRRELHEQNRTAFSARAKDDLNVLLARLTGKGHEPNVRPGGPMYGHAILVTAGDRRYAVMPAANQIWSNACRSNLRATTVIASDVRDRQRLGTARITAVDVSKVAMPEAPNRTNPAPPRPDNLMSPKPTSSPSSPPAASGTASQAAPLTRRERRLKRSAADEERALAAAAQRAEAELKRRETHLRRTADRLGQSLGRIDVDDGWIAAEIDGQTVLIGPSSSAPPEATKATSVVWSGTAHQADRLAAEGWTTVTRLSELQTPRS